MNKENLRNKLINVFKEHVSYDCNGYSPEKKCPSCSYVIEKESRWGFWLDHREVLSGNLFSELNLPERYRSDFDDWIGEQYVSGDKNEDAENFSKWILDEWVK